MKTIHSQLIAILLLVVGVCLFLGGVAGLGSLYMVSKDCESTAGVVKKYDRKRVYRHRKIRYESTMLVSYSTPKYGEMHVYKKSHCPFREVGNELTVWYDRNRPEAIRLPVSESILLVPWLFSGYYVHTVESVTGKRRRTNEQLYLNTLFK